MSVVQQALVCCVRVPVLRFRRSLTPGAHSRARATAASKCCERELREGPARGQTLALDWVPDHITLLSMQILCLEPYYGGSHKAFIDD